MCRCADVQMCKLRGGDSLMYKWVDVPMGKCAGGMDVFINYLLIIDL